MTPKPTIWIDLDNAPHVPFFAPIRRELEARGYEVWTTASGRYQVSELATLQGVPHRLLEGGYYGKSKVLKTLGIFRRAFVMLEAMRRKKPDLAISHGSRPQIVAAKMLGIPVALLVDYEYAKFPFTRVDCLITPEVIPDSPEYQCDRILKYPGLKEDVYATQFRPAEGILGELQLPPGSIVVTVRPPATQAHYHNRESEQLFGHVVQMIAAVEDAVMVVLPRSSAQGEMIGREWGDLLEKRKMVMPKRSLPGLDLIWASDLVISAGGTMNREAAALGVPVYSIFRGEIGAVDRTLAASGRLTLIGSLEEAELRIRIVKRERRDARTPSRRALLSIVNHLESLLQERSAVPTPHG